MRHDYNGQLRYRHIDFEICNEYLPIWTQPAITSSLQELFELFKTLLVDHSGSQIAKNHTKSIRIY